MYSKVKTNCDFAIAATTFFCFRRLILACTIAYAGHNFQQIWLACLICISNLVYLFIVVPYVDNVNMTVYIVNELACYICCLNMILFTDYVETAESRWKFGYVFMAAIITIGVINFSIAIVLEARNLYRDLKYKYIPDFKKKIRDFKNSFNI